MNLEKKRTRLFFFFRAAENGSCYACVCWTVTEGQHSAFYEKVACKAVGKERNYYQKMLELFGIGNGRMAFVKKKSIRNQFYSDLITPLENGIFVSGTTVHCFYAVKMGERYEKRYRKHFKSPDIHRHDLQHEELLMRYPDKWVREVVSCSSI